MTTINTSSNACRPQPSVVQRTTNTIENQVGKVGDALATSLKSGVGVVTDAVTDTVTGTAKLGVRTIGAIIDYMV